MNCWAEEQVSMLFNCCTLQTPLDDSEEKWTFFLLSRRLKIVANKHGKKFIYSWKKKLSTISQNGDTEKYLRASKGFELWNPYQTENQRKKNCRYSVQPKKVKKKHKTHSRTHGYVQLTLWNDTATSDKWHRWVCMRADMSESKKNATHFSIHFKLIQISSVAICWIYLIFLGAKIKYEHKKCITVKLNLMQLHWMYAVPHMYGE